MVQQGRLLEGGLALVTGAGRGIGAAIARALHDAGARVVIADRDETAARDTADALDPTGGTAWGYGLDVTDRDAIGPFADNVGALHGPVSIIVNNAGISGELPIDDPDTMRLWDDQIAVNLTGIMVMTRAFIPSLRETRGAIVNVASMSSFQAVTRSFGYQASKGGVKMLTQVMAKEFAGGGIRVNAVAPGFIATELTAKRMNDTEWMAAHTPRIALGRVGAPQDVGDPVVFLCSDMARYITGVTLPVDGGYLAL